MAYQFSSYRQLQKVCIRGDKLHVINAMIIVKHFLLNKSYFYDASYVIITKTYIIHMRSLYHDLLPCNNNFGK